MNWRSIYPNLFSLEKSVFWCFYLRIGKKCPWTKKSIFLVFRPSHVGGLGWSWGHKMDTSGLNWSSGSRIWQWKVIGVVRRHSSLWVPIGQFGRFSGPATSGGVPGGCKYFSERAAPRVGPDGSKVHNRKKFDPLRHPKPKIGPFESTKKGDIPPPLWGKGVHPLMMQF